MLTIKGVSKSYGAFSVLENINLEFSNGVYGLLAANGAGKTTLMKMLATLSRPNVGEIMWNGTDIHHLGAQYRDLIGYLPQDIGYYPNMSPKQYLEYFAALKGVDSSVAKRRIPELMEQVGLSDVLNKRMKKFSGGMIQRVGIAQALLNEPQILLLDEPTAGLDPKERVRFRNILSELSRDKIVILSTHIVSDVETVANQIILLKDKTVLYQGTVDDLCLRAKGSVYEINLKNHQIANFEQDHYILVHRQQGETAIVRFIDGVPPAQAYAVDPTLEDVFLMTYR